MNQDCRAANDKERILRHLKDLLKVRMNTEVPRSLIDRLLFYSPFVDCLASILWVVYSEAHTKDEIKKLLIKDLQKSQLTNYHLF
jgi:hypothetical protein